MIGAITIATLASALTAGSCDSMRDPDQRTYCRALQRGDSSVCYSIASSDLRTSCRAELLRNPSICSSVLDPAARELCRVRSGK